MKRNLLRLIASVFSSSCTQFILLAASSLVATGFAGCSYHRAASPKFANLQSSPSQTMLQQLSYTEIAEDACDNENALLTGTPLTISNFEEQAALPMTIEECVELALANSKVMQKLGGVVVNSPVIATTLFDQAITETNPFNPASVEAALSAFDAQVRSGLNLSHTERKFNNPFFGGGVNSQISNLGNFNFEISKQTAAGTSFAVRNLTDYNRNNNPLATPDLPFGNRFRSVYNTVNQVEVRQPLLRGYGTAVNRIAGPNAQPGIYNGVLIARIRSDISLTDFEIAVRNLVRDVEASYWELYFAYQDLDTKITARESARKTWENYELFNQVGYGKPYDEAQARQQYFVFQDQAQNALAGVTNGPPGVLGAERNLRRLTGLLASDGRLIRPISEPATAPVLFDWQQSQQQALERRAELRRQKWAVKQRELELLAANALNKWRFDLVGQYGFRGFGDDLFGNRNVPEGSAFADLLQGDLDDWLVGVEFGGAIGQRLGHLAVRHAELQLVREKTLLQEQQRQILHDLNAAYTEVDRAQVALKTSFNSFIAVKEEVDLRSKRKEGGLDPEFFLLDAQRREAQAESAVHRAVADYNLALLNYSFIEGSMLSRFNVLLTEGPWSEQAEINAGRNAARYPQGGVNSHLDIGPLTAGEYPQSAPTTASTTSNLVAPSTNTDEQPAQQTKPAASGIPPKNDSTRE